MSDLFEKEWNHAGFDCGVIMREMDGVKYHRCGYVRVLEKHPLFNVFLRDFYKLTNSDDIYLVDVHGGITFSGKFKDDDEGWWIGFDCAHLGDRKHPDYEKWEEENGMNIGIDWNAQFRDLDYVVKETNKLAEALSRCKLLKR